jgi:YgiT-type zinc finger domain-containing protein
VWAYNEANGAAVLITVYQPDPERWIDFREEAPEVSREGHGTIPLEEMFEVCPVCGGELEKKELEEIVRGGYDTATLKVEALVCLRCGEIIYHERTVRTFEEIRRKLRRGDTDDMTLVGSSYETPGD